MPGTDKITVYRGEDVTLSFTMDPAEDITGWTIGLNVYKLGPGTVITKSPATLDDAANGVFSFALTDTDTEAPAADEYTYDVWRTDSANERILAIGIFDLQEPARQV